MSTIHYRVLRVVVPVTGKEPDEPVLLLTDIEHAVKTIYEDYGHSVAPVDAALTDSYTVEATEEELIERAKSWATYLRGHQNVGNAAIAKTLEDLAARLERDRSGNVRDEQAGEKWAAKGQPEIEALDELDA